MTSAAGPKAVSAGPAASAFSSAGPVPVPPPESAAVGFTATIGVTDGGACAGLRPGEPPKGAASALGADELSFARFGSSVGCLGGGGGGGKVKSTKCCTTSTGRDNGTRRPVSSAKPSAN